MFPDIEVARFDLALSVGDGARDQPVLDRLSFLHPQLRHHPLDALGAEDTQQVVFERQKEPRCARIPLAPGTPAKLVVDTPALVPLGADDEQPARLDHLVALLHATALVLPEDLLVAPANLRRRSFHLLADLLDHLGVLTPFGLVARARRRYRFLVRLALLGVIFLGLPVDAFRLLVSSASRLVGILAPIDVVGQGPRDGAFVLAAGTNETGPRRPQRSFDATLFRDFAQASRQHLQSRGEPLLPFLAEVRPGNPIQLGERRTVGFGRGRTRRPRLRRGIFAGLDPGPRLFVE